MNFFIANGAVAFFCAVVWVCSPSWLSDGGNSFLKNFINHEILNVYGVLVAITLTNAAQVHLSLNRLEERRGDPSFFAEVRAELVQDAIWLIATFVIAVVALIVKGVLDGERTTALINAIALCLLFSQIMISWDVFRSVMNVSAVRKSDGEKQGKSEKSD